MGTELQFAKFQSILTSASWFHAWTPALELQTKNAIEIMCWFQKNNIGDLQLRSQERIKLYSLLKKLKEEPNNKITGLTGKTPRYGKTKTYFNKPSKCLKRMIVRDQENVFLSEFGLIVPAVLKCLFDIICADVVYPPGEKLSLFTNFTPVKDFLDVYNVEHPSQRRILNKFRNTESFLSFWHQQFRSNFLKFRGFASGKNVLHFGK